MDYESYRKKYYADPQPESQFNFSGVYGTALYYQDYQKALDFYTQVLGPPNYVEGENTHGWKIGNSWLTLFPSKEGNPKNVETPFYMKTTDAVSEFIETFVAAGGELLQEPVDELMYEPVRFAVVADPFGVVFIVLCKL